MADWGLIGGIASGLQSAAGSYSSTRNQMEEQALKRKLAEQQAEEIQLKKDMGAEEEGYHTGELRTKGVVRTKLPEGGYDFKSDKSLLKPEAPVESPAQKYGSQLRNEYQGLPEVKTHAVIQKSFNDLTKNAKLNTPQGDMGSVFAYMKLLDPASTVREGEYATAQNATGVPEKIVNLYNSALKGTKLNEQQKKDMVGSAAEVYNNSVARLSELNNKYSGLASQYGTTPSLVGIESRSPYDMKEYDRGLLGKGGGLINDAQAGTIPSKAMPVGATKVKDGVNYKKVGPGQWVPAE